MKNVIRPQLTLTLEAEKFKDYYWLKKELADFCAQQGLSTAGMKPEISERIYTFLKTGKKLKPTQQKITTAPDSKKPLTTRTKVVNYKNDPTTRQFFINQIGPYFHFSARVNIFRKEKIAAGEHITYGDLIKEWQKEHTDQKNNIKLPIMKSCEYNQFTRDYYAANPNAPRSKVIAAWKQAKTLVGAHTYEQWVKIFKN